MLARRLVIGVALLAALGLCFGQSGPVPAQSPASVRTYPLAGHGTLELEVARDWKDDVATQADLPPTITFSPSSGAGFQFLITPLWSQTSEADFNAPAKVRTFVEQQGRSLLSHAVEKQLVVSPLAGPNPGYFYSLTDRAPGPGEYRYLTQGAVAVDDLLVTFTFLSNRRDEAERNAVLGALAHARHRR
jgi:hypothetical protein